jgi:hypothetical protein
MQTPWPLWDDTNGIPGNGDIDKAEVMRNLPKMRQRPLFGRRALPNPQ